MSEAVNPVVWVEIPVVNMERAKLFYEAVFGWKLTLSTWGPGRWPCCQVKWTLTAAVGRW